MTDQYLARMGIVRWHLRVRKARQTRHCILKNAAGKVVGLMVADIDETISVIDQENLLQKIALALTPFFSFDDADLANHYEFVILLGSVNCEVRSKRIVKSFSLVELMRNTEYKKTLWRDMKTLLNA